MTPQDKTKALEWANLNAVTTEEALYLGIKGKLVDLDENIIGDAHKRASNSLVKMEALLI